MSTPSETPMVDAMVRTTTIESRHPLPPHHREFRDLEYVSVEDARKIEKELIEARKLIYLLEETPENFAELLKERNQLRVQVGVLERWKAEALHVESQWDVQKVGSLIGVPLGYLIQPFIQPKIEELLRQIAMLEEEE